MSGFTGLSFPMRLNSKGGLKMSTTSPTDFSDIEESIQQILNTRLGERCMELYFGSRVSTHIFDPSDDSSYALIRHEIVEALKSYEPRIEVETDDIGLTSLLDEITGKEFLHVTINYKVVKYDKTGTTSVNIGGLNNEV